MELLPIAELIRLEENYDYGTFGILRINKEVFCVTLEPQDELNTRNISSIPAQQYKCRRIVSPRFGETFQIMSVPGRDHVLFHAGNVIEHTQGCVLLGQYFGKLRGDRGVLNSGATFREFMGVMENHDTFHLTIREEY